MQKRIIFWVNVALCAGIVAVWATSLARRAALIVPEAVVVQPKKTYMAVARPDDSVTEMIPKQSATQELRGEIHAVRREADEELAKIHEKEAERREREALRSHSNSETRRLEIHSIAEFDEHVEELPQWIVDHELDFFTKRLTEGAQKRIQARQVVLDALAESSVSDEEYRQVQEFFAQMDEFDSRLELRDYAAEEYFNRFDPEILRLQEIIIRAAEGVDEKTMTWENLRVAVFKDNFGRFVLLPADMATIYPEEDDDDDDAE